MLQSIVIVMEAVEWGGCAEGDSIRLSLEEDPHEDMFQKNDIDKMTTYAMNRILRRRRRGWNGKLLEKEQKSGYLIYNIVTYMYIV